MEAQGVRMRRMANRKSSIDRKTTETNIRLKFSIDGQGKGKVNTGIPFLDHMLSLFAKHGLFDLNIDAMGDLDVDYHHTVEDIGIVLGQAITKAVGEKKGIRRYGSALLPMDETLASVALDISGMPLHIDLRYGRNIHHIFEAVFKAFGRALDEATTIDNRVSGVPSTKGR